MKRRIAVAAATLAVCASHAAFVQDVNKLIEAVD